MSDATFPDGIRAFDPHEKAPDYIIANITLKADELTQWMRASHVMGECRLVMKRSKAGKLYLQVDTYRPPQQTYEHPESRSNAQNSQGGYNTAPPPPAFPTAQEPQRNAGNRAFNHPVSNAQARRMEHNGAPGGGPPMPVEPGDEAIDDIPFIRE